MSTRPKRSRAIEKYLAESKKLRTPENRETTEENLWEITQLFEKVKNSRSLITKSAKRIALLEKQLNSEKLKLHKEIQNEKDLQSQLTPLVPGRCNKCFLPGDHPPDFDCQDGEYICYPIAYWPSDKELVAIHFPQVVDTEDQSVSTEEGILLNFCV